MTTDKIADLGQTRDRLKQGGGSERVAKQHKCGKLTARERVTLLLDRDSFQEAGLFAKHNARFFGMGDKDLPGDGVMESVTRFIMQELKLKVNEAKSAVAR